MSEPIFRLSVRQVEKAVRTAVKVGLTCDSCGRSLADRGCRVESVHPLGRVLVHIIVGGEPAKVVGDE